MLFSYILPVIYGYALVCELPCNYFIKFFSAIGLGLGISSIIAFIMMNIGLSELVFLPEIILSIIAIVFMKKKNIFPDIADKIKNCKEHFISKPNPLLLLIFIFMFLISIFMFISVVKIFPFGHFDGIFIWNLHAKFLYLLEDNWHQFFSSAPIWSHIDYPLLVPMIEYKTWIYEGNYDLNVYYLTDFIFYIATIGLTVFGLKEGKNINKGILAVILLFCIPIFSTNFAGGYVDGVLAYYVLLCFISVNLYLKSQNANFLFISSMSAGLTAWTKNEGFLFICVLIASFILMKIIFKNFSNIKQEIFNFVAGMLPFCSFVIYYKVMFAPQTDLFSMNSMDMVKADIFDITRYITISKYYFNQFVFSFPNVMTPAIIWLIGFLSGKVEQLNDKDKRFYIFGMTTIIMVFCGYFIVYLLTPHNIEYHLNLSLDRLMLQYLPAFVYVCFCRYNFLPEFEQK